MKGKKKRSAHVSRNQLDEAIAALIASTRRVRRQLSLVEIADRLETAREGLGNIRAVAKRLGLSEEMVRQFESVSRLSPQVRELIADRKIESVDVAHRLTKLRPRDQIAVARAFVRGEITSNDVRAIVSLRRAAPDVPIKEAMDRVKASRNIKEYLAMFVVPPPGPNFAELRRRFAKVVGKNNIRSLKLRGKVGTLAVNSEGRKRLQQAAKREGLTKRLLIDRIVSGEAT
jgi:hypothetical protein